MRGERVREGLWDGGLQVWERGSEGCWGLRVMGDVGLL